MRFYILFLYLFGTLVAAIHLDDPLTNFNFTPPIKSPNDLLDHERTLTDGEIPRYVLDHSPLIHLYSEEKYLPGDIQSFVPHFQLVTSNYETVVNEPLKISDLKGEYNVAGEVLSSETLYLHTTEKFEEDPSWLRGTHPEYGTGLTRDASSIVIVVDKGNGWVDAYWFYFYPFNLGPFIMGYGPWGNHIGDWEHSLVRFFKGDPQYIWMSAHGGGASYTYRCIEKKDRWRVTPEGKFDKTQVIKRPLLFSARGTHANYASVGQHAHDVPFFFSALSDFTDRGPLWDPSLRFYGFTYDGKSFYEKEGQEIGTSWLYFLGQWGNKQLKWSDPRQKWCPVQWKYIDGPKGPAAKNLVRTTLCERSKWWNFWHGCPVRRMIKRGQGLDAERNDSVGDNCGIALYRIRPKWLRSLFRLITWRGAFCAFMDYFSG